MNELATVDLRTGELIARDVPLSVTADDINLEHRLAHQSAESAVGHAIRCGHLLTAKKAELMPGEFDGWVAEHCEFQRATAYNYIKISKSSNALDGSAIRHLFPSGHNHRAQYTGEYEWYTPAEYIEAARAAMGGIDLDPASHEAAQLTVKASHFFTDVEDGRMQDWYGRVWMNPPYVQPLIHEFIEKLIAESVSGRVTQAIVLTHNSTDTLWFHRLEEVAARICFTRGRIAFIDPQGERCAPTQGQAFFYLGEDATRFDDVFKKFGFLR